MKYKTKNTVQGKAPDRSSKFARVGDSIENTILPKVVHSVLHLTSDKLWSSRRGPAAGMCPQEYDS